MSKFIVRGKPLALWTLIRSETLRIKDLVQYVIISSNGDISYPIKLSSLKNEKLPVPVVFSNSKQLICITLKKYENQYVITAYDQPYPQLVFYNYCPITLIITTNSEYKECLPFTADWKWFYTITPNNNSYLSFPHSSLNSTSTVFVVKDKKPFKSTYMRSRIIMKRWSS